MVILIKTNIATTIKSTKKKQYSLLEIRYKTFSMLKIDLAICNHS